MDSRERTTTRPLQKGREPRRPFLNSIQVFTFLSVNINVVFELILIGGNVVKDERC